jgi:amino acid transporter
MAHSPPNFAISVLGSAGSAANVTSITPVNGVYPPVIHYSGLPNPSSIIGGINGLMQGVYAYAGAQLFIEFMAEMKRPRDFLKAMWGAQFFIYTCYMVYGCYVYYFQGQYSYQVSFPRSKHLSHDTSTPKQGLTENFRSHTKASPPTSGKPSGT